MKVSVLNICVFVIEPIYSSSIENIYIYLFTYMYDVHIHTHIYIYLYEISFIFGETICTLFTNRRDINLMKDNGMCNMK